VLWSLVYEFVILLRYLQVDMRQSNWGPLQSLKLANLHISNGKRLRLFSFPLPGFDVVLFCASIEKEISLHTHAHTRAHAHTHGTS